MLINSEILFTTGLVWPVNSNSKYVPLVSVKERCPCYRWAKKMTDDECWLRRILIVRSLSIKNYEFASFISSCWLLEHSQSVIPKYHRVRCKIEYFLWSVKVDHKPNRGRISSVGRAFDCRAGGRGFDSRGRTITQGLKMTEKWRYFLCTASGETFAWLGWPRKMAVPSPLGEVKYSVPN